MGTILSGVISDSLYGRRCLTSVGFSFIGILSIGLLTYILESSTKISSNLNDKYGTCLNSFCMDTTNKSKTISNVILESQLSELIQSSGDIFSTMFNVMVEKIGSPLLLENLYFSPEMKIRLLMFLMGLGINGPKTLLGIILRDTVHVDVSY